MLTPAQCRAGRAMLRWSQEKLAKLAKVGVSGLRNFEAEKSNMIFQNLVAIFNTLTRAGIEFLPRNGLRLLPKEEKE